MKRHRPIWLLLLFALTAHTNALANDIDLGAGLSFINLGTEHAIDGGLDFQFGYEMARNRNLRMGAQLHLTQSLSTQSDIYAEGDLNYSSAALYLTLRPRNWWLQFKGGAVHADYKTYLRDESRFGYGIGAGIVADYMGVKLHLLDYQHFDFGDDSFNVYTISFTILR